MSFVLAALMSAATPPSETKAVDTIATEWRGEPVALLPRGLTSFGAESSGGWLYVFGGYHGEPHKYSRAGQSAEFLRLNLRDPRQFELLDGGVAVQGAPLAAHERKLYRAGGMVARNAPGEKADLHSIADAAVYDTLERAWTALPPLPEARSSHDLEVAGTHLVALGGWSLDGGRGGAYRASAALLDLERTEAGWRTVEAPFRRRALSAARIGARIAAIGGMDADGEVSKSVDLLDPATGAWTKGPDFPGEAFGVAACAVEGGVLASGKDGVVWRLDATTLAWSRAGTLAFPRFFHQIVADERGGALVLGGIDDMREDGRVRHVERLDPRRAAGALVSTFELPAPFAAKNRQGAFLRGNTLTLFGGNRSLKQHDFGPDDFQSAAWSLDLATLAWKPRAAFPEGRQTVASSVAGDGAVGFAVGGFGYAEGGGKARSAGYRYTFASDAWERAENVDLPAPRTQFGLVQGAGRMWVLGGLDFDPSRGEDAQFHHPSEILSLDLADANARFVDSGAKLTAPRRAFACAALDGRAYLVGGMREEFDTVDECEVFDCAAATFAPIAAPRRTRISAEMVAMGGKLYLVGGSSHGAGGKLAPDRSIECYDPATNTWSVVVEELPSPMLQMRAFALRDRLLVVSSHVDGPPTTRIALVAP
jgi:hypothetical protein